MPIVFVHGVNNRAGAEYDKRIEGRDAFLRRFVAPALGLPKDSLIRSPYWGGDGVKFAWKLASLPDPTAKVETFGSPEVGDPMLLADAKTANSLVELAESNLQAAVDLAFESALTKVTSERAAAELAGAYEACTAYVMANPAPFWLKGTSDANFIGHLINSAQASKQESFGAADVVETLAEGLSRINHVIRNIASEIALDFYRKDISATVATFLGDIFVYLRARGTPDSPGPIPKLVIDTLREAAAASNGEGLVIMAHSFGGAICYDVLTSFAPDIEVKCFITVGSQVGMFEEMKVYLASDPAVPSGERPKVEMPKNVQRWMNVFDQKDVLSFRADGVFEGVTDFHFDSSYGALRAHNGYFDRPSFYRRLADRLASEK